MCAGLEEPQHGAEFTLSIAITFFSFSYCYIMYVMSHRKALKEWETEYESKRWILNRVVHQCTGSDGSVFKQWEEGYGSPTLKPC